MLKRMEFHDCLEGQKGDYSRILKAKLERVPEDTIIISFLPYCGLLSTSVLLTVYLGIRNLTAGNVFLGYLLMTKYNLQ